MQKKYKNWFMKNKGSECKPCGIPRKDVTKTMRQCINVHISSCRKGWKPGLVWGYCVRCNRKHPGSVIAFKQMLCASYCILPRHTMEYCGLETINLVSSYMKLYELYIYIFVGIVIFSIKYFPHTIIMLCLIIYFNFIFFLSWNECS